jgi:hypothetical protein
VRRAYGRARVLSLEGGRMRPHQNGQSGDERQEQRSFSTEFNAMPFTLPFNNKVDKHRLTVNVHRIENQTGSISINIWDLNCPIVMEPNFLFKIFGLWCAAQSGVAATSI